MTDPQGAPPSAAPKIAPRLPKGGPMLESVGAALRFVRQRWRVVAVVAAIGAAASTAVSMASAGLGDSPLTLLLSIAATFIGAGVYASLIGAALSLPNARARLVADTARMWAAMAVITFFLFIVAFALMLPCAIALAPYISPYTNAVQAASGNEEALMVLGARFAQENPGIVLGVVLLFAVVFLLLTSRFFIAGPASIDAKRILTFETWNWTKGSMLRIAAARIVVLGPALVLAQTLSLLFARAFGVDAMQGGQLRAFAEHNPAVFTLFAFVSEFITILFYNSLEAGLASSLYRTLRPQTRPE